MSHTAPATEMDIVDNHSCRSTHASTECQQRTHSFDGLGEEIDEGNIEYKFRLTNLDPAKIQRRASQMRYRVNEGSGECFYYLGIHDDGTVEGIEEACYSESVANLTLIANSIDCVVMKIQEQQLKSKKWVGHFLIRESEKNSYVSLTLGVVGNVDSGKSSTIGVLTKGVLDDGRGRARLHVFNHKHEIASGRTSSIGHQILGFDALGEDVNSKYDRLPSWSEIVGVSSKVVSFFDLAGHERYLKTTIYGLTTIYPDYSLVLVGANMGVSHMTKEHMSLCLTLKIPFIVLVTKIDIVPANVLEETMAKINEIVKKGARKTPFGIKSVQDVIDCARTIKSDSIVPVLQISNVTAFNLDLLKLLLNVLPARNDYLKSVHEPLELLVDNSYCVTGHPTIVSGMLRKGIINVGDTVCLGPYYDATFKATKVKSIHNKFRDVRSAKAGHYICLSLKGVTRGEIKKGMVLVADREDCKIAVREFWCFINILHSPTTIRVGYQPFVHVDQVRQSVKILEISKISSGKGGGNESVRSAGATVFSSVEGAGAGVVGDGAADDESSCLRTGDKAHIRVKFLLKPEYIKPQMKLIFREGRVKAAGRVIAKGVDTALPVLHGCSR